MKKYSIFLLILCGLAFYLWMARSGRKKSDDTLEKFNEVNSTLNVQIDSTNSLHGIEGVEKMLPLSLLKSETILLIDSLKGNYIGIADAAKPIEVTKRLKPDFLRLLHGIQQLNRMKLELSKTADTIKYWSETKPFNDQEWFSMMFEETPNVAIITYLNYLKNQTVAIN